MSRKKKPALEPLEERIGHRFENRALLEQALTHMSMVRGGGRKASYQRLEFLGDRVLGLSVCEMLMRAFPKASEGELSQRLSQHVRKAACVEVAAVLELAPHIRLDRGKPTPTIIADVCEAVIGAVFLDAGYGAALEVVERHWGERLTRKARPQRDAKTLLQEWALARGLPAPNYREVERRGPDHKPEFKIAVELPGLDVGEGVGRTKRDAEQAAAAMMLARASALA
ncbi:MAG TPA: ribonuclease III, partial [Xanthobacteraceae bacterium]|nr:ribonuclease III [Xanthobacteraceae bacterium]